MHVSYQAFIRYPDDRLEAIAEDRWNGFCEGALPLADQLTGRAEVDILLLTIRRDSGDERLSCELVEPLTLQLDANGYLRRLHVDLEPLPAADVVDLRPRFLAAYLRRAHQWTPTPALLDSALACCRLTDDGVRAPA